MKRVALVLLVAYPFAITWAQPADADTNRFRQWEHDEWRDFVLLNPQIGRDFAQAKLNVLLSEERDVVHVAYALGLAEYFMGRHLLSNNWYNYALNRPEFREQSGPVWSDHEKALRKKSAQRSDRLSNLTFLPYENQMVMT